MQIRRTQRSTDPTGAPIDRGGEAEGETAPRPDTALELEGPDSLYALDTLRPPPLQSSEFALPLPPRVPAEWENAHAFAAALSTGTRKRPRFAVERQDLPRKVTREAGPLPLWRSRFTR